ncbi:MAG TPA: hypothetical protein ENI15_17040, partial [Spirochaetes bacterium]|nr:hypothetical protein [Spirochaetota bacterium]
MVCEFFTPRVIGINIIRWRYAIQKLLEIITLLLVVPYPSIIMSASKAKEEAAPERAEFLSKEDSPSGIGVIVPPGEVYIDSFVGYKDYNYPEPEGEAGVTLYNVHRRVSTWGQEGIIQIGIQGMEIGFEELPVMNLAFVIDKSSTMQGWKMDWVKESFEIFIDRVIVPVARDLDMKLEYQERIEYAREEEIKPPVEGRSLSEHLANLIREMSLDLRDRDEGVLVVTGFTGKEEKTRGLAELINGMAELEFSGLENMELLEKSVLESALEEKRLSFNDLADAAEAVRVGERAS